MKNRLTVLMFLISGFWVGASYGAKPSPTPAVRNQVKPAPNTKAPDPKQIVECDAGDSKCMESKAKLEVKPSDGAIQKEKTPTH